MYRTNVFSPSATHGEDNIAYRCLDIGSSIPYEHVNRIAALGNALVYHRKHMPLTESNDLDADSIAIAYDLCIKYDHEHGRHLRGFRVGLPDRQHLDISSGITTVE